jgi:hypothetical protein
LCHECVYAVLQRARGRIVSAPAPAAFCTHHQWHASSSAGRASFGGWRLVFWDTINGMLL